MLRLVALGSLANLALPLSALITGPLLARALDPTGRGLMAALLLPVSLANLLLTCGMPEALSWFTAKRGISNQKALRLAVSSGLGIGFLGIIILILIGRFFVPVHDHWIWLNYCLIAATLPVTLAVSAIRGIVLGRSGFMYVNTERVVGVILRFAGLLALFVFGEMTPASATWTTILCGIVGSCALVPGLRQKEATEFSVSTREVWVYAASTALGTVGGLLVLRIDHTLMAALSAAEQLGYYSVAASLAELPLAAVTAVRDLIFTTSARAGDGGTIPAQACRFTLLLLIPVSLSIVAVVPFVLPLIFGAVFRPAVAMAQILFVGTSCSAINSLLGVGLMTLGLTKIRSIVQIAGAAETVTLILILAPRFGGLGTAFATTVTYASMACATTILYARHADVSLKTCLLPTWADVVAVTKACRVVGRRLIPAGGA